MERVMVKIIHNVPPIFAKGHIWLTKQLTCPHCTTTFQLEEHDLATITNDAGEWHVITERSLGGKSYLSWRCPSCKKPVGYARRNTEATQPADWQQLAGDAKIVEE